MPTNAKSPSPCSSRDAMRSPTAHQEGNAYIVVLVVLVLLSVVGVSVTLISQTELLIGGTETTVNRAFYAADSGIAASTTRALVAADFASKTIELPDGNDGRTINLHHEVALSPFYPTLEAPCNLCEINNVGTYSERSYRAINYAITAVATRKAGTLASPLASATVGSIIEVQPWNSNPEAYLPIDDASELEKIKF